LFRVLEQKLHEAFTAEEIVKTLRSMAFIEARGEGYIPAYRRSDLTDALHEAFGFNTDYEIVSLKLMRSILRETKKH
ncbi:MAG: transposase, partial [Oscillospiraceae bacterium]|nr:transposase [Oscillospiraceae bacterium]MDD4369064.1 transposase [Oscillospiraceae bacterium]